MCIISRDMEDLSMKCSGWRPFWKMAATDDTGQIQLGTIAKLVCIDVFYKCAKFHAFTTKCTILADHGTYPLY